MYMRMLVCSSLRIGLNNIFLTPDSVKKKSKLSLRFTLMFNPIPHNQRMAAVRLYELGAKNTAIEGLPGTRASARASGDVVYLLTNSLV